MASVGHMVPVMKPHMCLLRLVMMAHQSYHVSHTLSVGRN